VAHIHYAPHVVLREAGLTFDLEKFDLSGKITAGGTDLKTVNPEGYVPALQLDNGQALTEGLTIAHTLPIWHVKPWLSESRCSPDNCKILLIWPGTSSPSQMPIHLLFCAGVLRTYLIRAACL
jgi:hypothetical protein